MAMALSQSPTDSAGRRGSAAILKAPFPWFGGKSRAADLIWPRLGNPANYVEPFAGSLAVLLARPDEPNIETVNDKDCVGPETKILRSDLTWARAGDIAVGDRLLAFDESNGEPRTGLRAPKRYRRLTHGTVTAIRVIRKPSYKLTFDDGTVVVASENHLWLGGSHRSGGRGWRWMKTGNMVCNRKTQRTWVLKVTDVVNREDSWEAGWLGGLLDGEGSLKVGPGLRISLSQNAGPVLDRAEQLLRARAVDYSKSELRKCKLLQIKGGLANNLSILMRLQPARLIEKLADNVSALSLYGRSHRAVGLVEKEFLGEQEVVAIETDCHTFVAEGLASHNCYLSNFWRAVRSDPDGVAAHADWPVNEADLHARHLWLVNREAFRERMKTDPDYHDAKIAGWWVWGISQWIGSGWCSRPDWTGRTNAGRAPRGVHRKLPNVDGRGAKGIHGIGVHRQIPHLGNAGRGVHQQSAGHDWFQALAQRLRRVRVCCGDWTRLLGPSVTTARGVTAILLDPPYDFRVVNEGTDRAAPTDKLYSEYEHELSGAVAAWAFANGDNPMLRIALCGYEGEHDPPEGWDCVHWKARGGYGSQGNGAGRENAKRERIWFSPHCLKARQGSLFDDSLHV